jgi:uncharacterized membrane protein
VTAQGIVNDYVKLSILKYCFILFFVLAAGVVCIMLCIRVKPEYIYLVAAFCIGLTYMFAITPLSPPDETHHYHSAYILSGYILRSDDPYMADSGHFDYKMIRPPHNNLPSAYLRVLDEGVYILHDNEAELKSIKEPYDIKYPIVYIPQALGIFIARLIGLSFFGVFYLGRLFNLLFYITCVFFSIKRVEAFKLPLLLIGLLPLSLQQAASFSYDSFINALSMLFIAYVISSIYENNTFKWRDYAVLLITGVLLAPAKFIYLPIVFLVFLVAVRWKNDIKGRAWILSASIVAASIIMAVIIFIGSNAQIPINNEGATNWEGGYNYTLSFVIENPLTTVMIFLRTLHHEMGYLIYSTFGRYLSGQTIILPMMYINIIMVLLIASIFYGNKDQWRPSIKDRIIYISISGIVVALCMASMFFGFTSDFRIVIAGVQGRYFIPLLPLALLAIRFAKFQISYRFFYNAVIAGFLLISGIIMVYILDHTINSTIIGF